MQCVLLVLDALGKELLQPVDKQAKTDRVDEQHLHANGPPVKAEIGGMSHYAVCGCYYLAVLSLSLSL